MGSGGSGGVGGAAGNKSGIGGFMGNAGIPGTNIGGGGSSGVGGSGGYAPQANTPEMRTYKDANGNTVRVYQRSDAGRMSAVGYKEVYSPSGQLISSTKPQASANTPQTTTKYASGTTQGQGLSGPTYASSRG